MKMKEIVIKNVEYLFKANLYIAKCIIVEGTILQNEEWFLKTNPKLKITFNSPVITKGLDKEKYFLDFTINKPDFDINMLNKPTTWIKR